MAKIRKFAVFILTSFFSLCFYNISKAQDNYYEEEQHTFQGGLVLGTNFTQVDGDNFAGYHKVGLNAGGIIYTRIAEHVAVSMEILFSQKGSRAHHSQLSNTKTYLITRYDINLNYAEVPIQINYYDKRKSHFGAGFSYSQLISYKETVETDKPLNPPVDIYKDYPFKKFDVNFVVGGNLHLVKGLFLNLRYQYSMLPIRENIHAELGRSKQLNNMWTLRLMYLF